MDGKKYCGANYCNFWLEHLTAYYCIWKTTVNQHFTNSQTQTQRRNIDTEVHNFSRVTTVHHQLENPGPSFRTQPSAGLLEPNMTVTTLELYHLQPLPEPMLSDDNAPGESSTTHHKQKRAADIRNSAQHQQPKSPLAGEHGQKMCWKCGNEMCGGQQKQELCRNACMDCGRYDCNGMTS